VRIYITVIAARLSVTNCEFHTQLTALLPLLIINHKSELIIVPQRRDSSS
jgi:hypothetical protein